MKNRMGLSFITLFLSCSKFSNLFANFLVIVLHSVSIHLKKNCRVFKLRNFSRKLCFLNANMILD